MWSILSGEKNTCEYILPLYIDLHNTSQLKFHLNAFFSCPLKELLSISISQNKKITYLINTEKMSGQGLTV